MDKTRFLFLSRNYSSLTKEEAEELDTLQSQYPFSQIIQSLAARAASQNNLGTKDLLLHLAAVGSTDRSVLKRVITAPPTMRKSVEETVDTGQPVSVTPPAVESASNDDFLEEVMNDLNMLRESKHNFELLLDHMEKHPGESLPVFKTKKKAASLKSTKGVKKSEPDSGLIDEIKSSKKKIKATDPKHQEQIEIINKFIKSQPSIGKGMADGQQDASDLSEKSTAIGDHLVSETFVAILLKQGKKDKAIDMLRKLIWKFPQKKAYFAAQIEELKR